MQFYNVIHRPLIFISAVLSLFYAVYEEWYSFFIFWLSGIAIAYFLLKRYKDSSILFSLFIFAYSFYTIYMCITNFIYVENPSSDFFMMVDSMKFWDFSNYPIYGISDVFKYFFQNYAATTNYTLFNFISLLISFLAQIIDTNNILVQKLQSVFLGAMSMPFIYLIIKKYTLNSFQAYKYTLFFAVFSYVCIYSIVLNRDPYIYFFYTLGAYLIVYHEQKKFILFKLIIIQVLLFGFRFEHGLFFITFIFGYIYLVEKKNRFTILIVSAAAIVALSPILLSNYNDTSEQYEEDITNVERKEASMGAAFAQLPPGIKQIAMAVNAQIAPAVPFWRGWYNDYINSEIVKHEQPGYYTPWRFMESIAAIVWIYIWGIVIYAFFRKWYRNVPLELLILFLISILLLLAASSSANARRIYCVYPIVFTIAMLFYSRMDKKMKNKILSRGTLFLVFLYSFYFVIK